MMAEGWNRGKNQAAATMQRRSKHICMAFYMWSLPRLHNEDHLDRPVSQKSELVVSPYLAMASDNRITTEDFTYAVVVVICRVYINGTDI